MKKKSTCRCCGSTQLLKYLNLGKQPLANSYHKDGVSPLYPLEVMVCKNCFHNQLSVVVDPDKMFKKYLYVSGTTSTFQLHMKSLAVDAVRRFAKKKLYVLDIACNDGVQLEYFRDLGCDVIGVDPAENLRSITEKKKIKVIVDYWTKKTADQIKKRFDIITATNVFAHVDDVHEFLQACKKSLAPGGIIIIEFPYVDNMIANNEFDTVYHEHLSYFLVNSFKILVEKLNMHIVDVLQTKIHGGSIRFFLQDGVGNRSKKISKLIIGEKRKELLKIETYKKFSIRVAANKKNMKQIVRSLRKQGKKIIGYGASAKGNTMLNYFKLDLSYIVDDNPFKHGFKTPGRNIPIESPAVLNDEKSSLAIVVLSWNFFNEIMQKIIKRRGLKRNDSLLLYVPDVKEIRVGDKIKLAISA